MRVLLVVFLAVAVVSAQVAYADLSSVLLGKIASRAVPYNRDDARLDEAAAAAMKLAGQSRTSGAPLAGTPLADQPQVPTMPTPAPTREPEQNPESMFRLGAVDGRLGLRNVRTWYTTGNTSIKTELGYDGKLRLEADRPWLGGNLRFGFADEQGRGELRLEFKRNF